MGRELARVVAEHSFGLIVFAVVLGLGIGVNCGGPGETIPTFVEPVPASTPGTVEVVPSVIAPGGGGSSWTENGVKVTIVADEWGAGSCHTNGGTRTLEIENGRDHAIYSNLGAFTDPALVCATQHTPTGKPTMSGPTNIGAGETGTVSYTVTTPECGSLQADDCWGPGGFSGCSFVIGDAFKSSKTCDGCVEDPTERSATECGEWGECHEHPQASTGTPPRECFREQACLETKTIDYVCKPDETTTREFENVEECPCDCVEEGPYEGGTVWADAILEGSCPDTFAALTGGPKCHQDGTQTTTWDCRDPTETSVCRPVECPNGCVIPPEGTTLSWHGPANCEAECSAFGDQYQCSDNGADFWICKAGNDRIVEHSFPDGDNCRNGKEVSHVRACVCEDDD